MAAYTPLAEVGWPKGRLIPHPATSGNGCLKQVPQLQIKAVASPRNHQERTAVSRGGGGRFLLSESEDLSQRNDNDDLAVATCLARLDFDSLDKRTDRDSNSGRKLRLGVPYTDIRLLVL